MKLVMSFGAVLLALGLTTASAQRPPVRDLATGALQNRDLPAGFEVAKLKLYTHFSKTVVARVAVAGGNPSPPAAICSATPGISSRGFRQGMLEAVVNRGTYGRLMVCGWRLRTSAGAHNAFQKALSTAGWWVDLKRGIYHQLKTGNLGDAAYGVRTRVSYLGAGYPRRDRLDILYFTHSNAFFSLNYEGPRVLTTARLVQLAMVIDKKLR